MHFVCFRNGIYVFCHKTLPYGNFDSHLKTVQKEHEIAISWTLESGPFSVFPLPHCGRFFCVFLFVYLCDSGTRSVSDRMERKKNEHWNRKMSLCAPKLFDYLIAKADRPSILYKRFEWHEFHILK